jgi:RHS repeat-associated protein
VTTDGGDPKTRSHNKQNEITSIEDQTTPTYDANGNMTGDETGKQFVYDAWNRLKVVKSSGGATLETLAYDGLGRRVSAVADSVTTDLYYANGWQVVEDRVDGDAVAQYAWSLAYVDALVLRDRDTDANGSLDERLWPQQDANWNVTALVNGSGVAQERLTYNPFGAAQVRNANWNVLEYSGYLWDHQHQGLQLDAAGALYNRSRQFNSALGRYYQLDLAGYAAGDTNLYRYLANSPVSSLDPSGLATLGQCFTLLGFVHHIGCFSGALSGLVVGVVVGVVSNGPLGLLVSGVGGLTLGCALGYIVGNSLAYLLAE